MREPMTIESLPSWKALNKEYPRKDFSQDAKYITISVVAVLITFLVAYVIVNNQKENDEKEIEI
ncbi:hypothetical protein OAA96_00970 [Polaribacter sp.]|nr:hypothetical protein [Polaribacter sp.]